MKENLTRKQKILLQRRERRWGRFTKVLYWTFVICPIGIVVGRYFLQLLLFAKTMGDFWPVVGIVLFLGTVSAGLIIIAHIDDEQPLCKKRGLFFLLQKKFAIILKVCIIKGGNIGVGSELADSTMSMCSHRKFWQVHSGGKL